MPAMTRAALVLALALGAAGCSRKPANATPDGAVRELVDRMERVQGDPADTKAAFELLSKRAQANLAARAQRYTDGSGKPMPPEGMIAPAHFVLRFKAQKYSAQIVGTNALVEVTGLLPSERAAIPCVLEDGGWRVDVSLPPLPPEQKRPGSE